jgi:hypothetical protein
MFSAQTSPATSGSFAGTAAVDGALGFGLPNSDLKNALSLLNQAMGAALNEFVVVSQNKTIPPPDKGKKACNANGGIRTSVFSGQERGLSERSPLNGRSASGAARIAQA